MTYTLLTVGGAAWRYFWLGVTGAEPYLMMVRAWGLYWIGAIGSSVDVTLFRDATPGHSTEKIWVRVEVFSIICMRNGAQH